MQEKTGTTTTTTDSSSSRTPSALTAPSLATAVGAANSVYGQNPYANLNTGQEAPLTGTYSGGLNNLYNLGTSAINGNSAGSLVAGDNAAADLANTGTSNGYASGAYGGALTGIGSLESGYTPGVAGDAYNDSLVSLGGLTSSTSTSPARNTFADASSQLQKTLNGDYLSPSNNPALQSAISQGLAQAVPAATASFTGGNRSDSGLASLAQATAADNTAGNIEYQNYAQERQNQLTAASEANSALTGQEAAQTSAAGLGVQAQQDQNATAAQGASLGLSAQGQQNSATEAGAQLGGSLYGTSLAGLGQAVGAGSAYQQYAQTALNNQIAQANQGQLANSQNAGEFDTLLNNSGALNYYNTTGTGTNSQPYYSNPYASGLAGVTGGLGLLNTAGNTLSGATGGLSGISSLFGLL